MSSKPLRWVVSKRENRPKLLSFLKEKLKENFSNRDLKRKIESNLCQVNGRFERFASTQLSEGDEVVFFNESVPKRAVLPLGKENILFEDEYFLIFNKPVGFTCDLPSLKKFCDQKLFFTHRLDKETTGVLILAKSSKSAQLMEDLFRKREIKKTYLAIVEGIPNEKSGKIENYLGKITNYQGNAIYGSTTPHKGQLAITFWSVKKKGKAASLIVCLPVTGRTHQIRVHLSELGHPILGDHIYGDSFATLYRPSRILLHAYKVQFKHPISQMDLEVIAPIPADFREAQKALL